MDAVTARLSGFVSALTQFLNSNEIRQLACVSILDHRLTEELWTMGSFKGYMTLITAG